MPQSFHQLYCHLVFSTKNRYPFLDSDIRHNVHRYIANNIREYGAKYVIVGGVEDHVHILFECPKSESVLRIISKIKQDSSKFIKTLGSKYQHFYWQRGYGAFSIGHKQVLIVEKYILQQEEHHKQISFQDEYRQFLNNYKIDFNENYLWD